MRRPGPLVGNLAVEVASPALRASRPFASLRFGVWMLSVSTYAYDNDLDIAARQHACLSAMLDPFTTGRLEGLGDPTGWRCLEAGAGGSGVPAWLADLVGPTGAVTATDIKPRRIPAHSRVRTLTHDILTGVPDGPYDLIHARLLLIHLTEREAVLRRLAAALRPGGRLVIEDWYLWPDHVLLDAPTAGDAELFDRYQRVLIDDVLVPSGADPTWAARIHSTMRRAGLSDVDTEIHAPVWPAGSPGTMLATVNLTLFRDQFLAAGLTGDDLDRLHHLVTDPTSGLVIRGHLLFSAAGHRLR